MNKRNAVATRLLGELTCTRHAPRSMKKHPNNPRFVACGHERLISDPLPTESGRQHAKRLNARPRVLKSGPPKDTTTSPSNAPAQQLFKSIPSQRIHCEHVVGLKQALIFGGQQLFEVSHGVWRNKLGL
jgi:hypothetical protein